MYKAMEAKTSVVKSKSSNSAKTSKSEYRNKKSRSNVEFQPFVMKKRGVYVGPAKLSANELEKNQIQERPKAPPRPKPGNKKFLASVLTILSKSTAGTQYPDTNEAANKKNERRPRRKPTTDKMDSNDARAKQTNENIDTDKVKGKKKPKYRSKALTNEVDKDIDQFVVLQSQKNIIHTPSIYSENDSFNWSNLPSLVKRAQRQNKEAEEKNDIVNELAKEIMEGQKSRKERRVRIDEPTTLVADVTPKKESETVGEANGKLYNFFVDLLETTISVYNVKQEYDKIPPAPSESSSTKVPLEINESVAKKLNEPRELPEKIDTISQPSSHFFCLKDLEIGNRPDPENIAPKRAPKKKQYKSESFSFMNRPVKKKTKKETVVETKRSFSRKDKKKNLLNLFKEQLRMDEDAFEEPQNLYQALKVIAQNKKRCQKTIHFEQSLKRRHKDFGFPECMFKRRKVISPSTKGSKKNYVPSISGRMSEMSGYNRTKSEYTTDAEDHDSYHSLEVYGYDYETPGTRKAGAKSDYRKRELVFTYHSTPSHSEHSFGSRGMLEFSETDSMYFF